jgi:hypothetical protein
VLGILLGPGQAFDPASSGPLDTDFQHGGIDVGNGDLGTGTRHSKRDVAGAAGHVEHRLAAPGLHAADELILPQPVHAARHEVVHQVVAGCNPAEHGAHAPCLLLGCDLFVAETDLVHRRAS